MYVLQFIATAKTGRHELPNITDYGWTIQNNIPMPIWDSDTNINTIDILRQSTLRRCGCKKSGCITNQCRCFKQPNKCTVMCTCQNCKNIGSSNIEIEDTCESDGEESEAESVDTETDSVNSTDNEINDSDVE